MKKPGIAIRNFQIGDETILREVFYSSVHTLAKKEYSPEQLREWAPAAYDAKMWGERIRRLKPFVAEIAGVVAGYADLQDTGYIDHFYVRGSHGGMGVGRSLMAYIHQVAKERGILRLSSDVSLSAESFFIQNGFQIEKRNSVLRSGVELNNARMSKEI